MKQNFTQKLAASFIVLGSLFLGELQAQTNGQGFALLFNSGSYVNEANLAEFTSEFNAMTRVHAPVQYKIIQFYEIPKYNTQQELVRQGVTLFDYVPNKAYLAAIQANANVGKLSDLKVRGVFDLKPEYKLSLDLLAGNLPSHAIGPDGRVELYINFFPNISPAAQNHILTTSGATLVAAGLSENTITARINPENLSHLAAQPGIYYIEPIGPPGEPENYTGRTLHRSNVINTENPLGRRYDGTGIRVMLQDDGVIGPHIDYQGRTTHYVSSNSGDHGDHCAGILMGAGNLDPKQRGMASGALISVYAYSGLSGFNSLSTHYHNPGVRITSTSYSDGCNTGYTTTASNMDQQMRQYPKLMHVFSAGNEGRCPIIPA